MRVRQEEVTRPSIETASRGTRYTFEWTPRLVEDKVEFLISTSDMDAEYELQNVIQDRIPDGNVYLHWVREKEA